MAATSVSARSMPASRVPVDAKEVGVEDAFVLRRAVFDDVLRRAVFDDVLRRAVFDDDDHAAALARPFGRTSRSHR
ncbi:hypothetical protein [Haloplanus rubicundus]|uniref:hypothetical protein n=1 Tax=Haloplanus rubicundus TaxID=1547898 RepID=UPI0021CAF43A|nr:hypothetical protein [Haloplanus rubicundus]